MPLYIINNPEKFLPDITRFLYNQNFYRQHQAEVGKEI